LACRLTEARYQWRRALQFGPDKDDVPPIEAKLDHGLAPISPASSPAPAKPTSPAERGG
jgi:hypothetical protein